MRQPFPLAAALVAAVILTPTARAQQEVAARPVNDAAFVAAAAASGMAEVTISQMVEQRSQNQQIKEFAQKMVEEHNRANLELRQIAAARQIAIPVQLQFTDQAAAEALAGISGAKFDREYAKNQVAAHLCAVALFQAEAERGRDPQIRAYAEKYLPKIAQHLKQVGDLAGMPMPASSTPQPVPATAQPATERPASGLPATERPATVPPAAPTPGAAPLPPTTPGAEPVRPATPGAEPPPAPRPGTEPVPPATPGTDQP